MSATVATRVLVIAVGDREAGSTKYRLVQYEPWLREHGVELEFVHRDAITATTLRRAAEVDVLFVQKCLIRTGVARALLQRAKRAIFDIDDAIWTRPGRPYSLFTRWRTQWRLHTWLKGCHTVIAANQFLADHCRRWTSRLAVIQNAVDLTQWAPAAKPAAPATVTMGWAGAPVNVPYLEAQAPALQEVLTRHPEARLAVFSGRRPRLPVPFTYVPFAPGTEADFTRHLDIGLLPLPDEEYAHGKSSIKAIQYLAFGIPIVGNIVGAAAEICRPDNSLCAKTMSDWSAALSRLIDDGELRRRLGSAGRRHAEANHCYHKNAARLLSILQGEPA